MSKLTEYLYLIPEGLKNIGPIVNGLRNQIRMEIGIIPPEHEDEIIRRRLICADCPFMSVNAIKMGTYITSRTDVHCTGCGCPIETRTASLESECGLANYNIQNPNNQIPLKWEKYKK